MVQVFSLQKYLNVFLSPFMGKNSSVWLGEKKLHQEPCWLKLLLSQMLGLWTKIASFPAALKVNRLSLERIFQPDVWECDNCTYKGRREGRLLFLCVLKQCVLNGTDSQAERNALHSPVTWWGVCCMWGTTLGTWRQKRTRRRTHLHGLEFCNLLGGKHANIEPAAKAIEGKVPSWSAQGKVIAICGDTWRYWGKEVAFELSLRRTDKILIEMISVLSIKGQKHGDKTQRGIFRKSKQASLTGPESSERKPWNDSFIKPMACRALALDWQANSSQHLFSVETRDISGPCSVKMQTPRPHVGWEPESNPPGNCNFESSEVVPVHTNVGGICYWYRHQKGRPWILEPGNGW